MEQEKIVEQAVAFLENLDLSTVERLEVSNNRYDDGSTVAEISVTYYAQKEDKASERK